MKNQCDGCLQKLPLKDGIHTHVGYPHISICQKSKYEEDPIMCGRCYAEVDRVYDAPCLEKPEKRCGEPIGMYHCPECSAMLIACCKHPQLCRKCISELGVQLLRELDEELGEL